MAERKQKLDVLSLDIHMLESAVASTCSHDTHGAALTGFVREGVIGAPVPCSRSFVVLDVEKKPY